MAPHTSDPLHKSAPPDRVLGQLRDWVPVRTLAARHRERVVQHLLALSDHDRLLRFGYLASDERIRDYTAHIDFERDEVFGVFNRRLELVAMAHLAFGDKQQATPGTAEFGVSVHAKARGKRLGARLFEHAVTHARNRGIHTLVIHTMRDNGPMLAIVRRAGASLSFDGGDVIAQLPLPADTLGSQLEEMFSRQAAEMDYRMKTHALRVDLLPRSN